MRKSKRYIKKFSERFIVYIVVFVAFVNACFFMPIQVQASDGSFDFSKSLSIHVGFVRVVNYSAPVSPFPDNALFRVVKTSSAFHSSNSSNINISQNGGKYNGTINDAVFDTYEVGTFQSNLVFRFDFNYDHVNSIAEDGYINFPSLDIQFYFRFQNDSSVHPDTFKGVFDTPYLINVPNGNIIYTRLEPVDSGQWVLTLNLSEFSYQIGQNFQVVCPYTCSVQSPMGSTLNERFDITIADVYNVGVTGIGYPGLSTKGNLENNVQDLVDGYNDSAGNQVSSDFESGVNDYDQAEDNLFNTSTGVLQGFEFFDFGSFSAVTSGLSFCSSLLTSIYENFGGINGIGIVISVLFSVLFMAIVIGLFRYYK